jgi:hypothetical protein
MWPVVVPSDEGYPRQKLVQEPGLQINELLLICDSSLDHPHHLQNLISADDNTDEYLDIVR